LAFQLRQLDEKGEIVGRGTRLFEGKDFFTIIDFSDEATDRFFDAEWDGLPEGTETGTTGGNQ
jgi:type I restriction enzyme R subunit